MAPSESLAYRQLLLSRERKAFAPQDDEALRHSSSSQNQRLKHRKKMSFFMLEACEELDIDNSTAFKEKCQRCVDAVLASAEAK